jgi:hypothetical protein
MRKWESHRIKVAIVVRPPKISNAYPTSRFLREFVKTSLKILENGCAPSAVMPFGKRNSHRFYYRCRQREQADFYSASAAAGKTN